MKTLKKYNKFWNFEKLGNVKKFKTFRKSINSKMCQVKILKSSQQIRKVPNIYWSSESSKISISCEFRKVHKVMNFQKKLKKFRQVTELAKS